MPEAAKKHTPEGGIAYIKYFFDQANTSWTAPDPHALDGLGDAGCRTCASLASTAERLAAAGQHYDRAPAEVSEFRSLGRVEAGRDRFSFTMHQVPAQVLDGQGKVLATESDVTENYVAELSWRGDRWYVYDIG